MAKASDALTIYTTEGNEQGPDINKYTQINYNE